MAKKEIVDWTDLGQTIHGIRPKAVASKQKTASRSFNSGLWRTNSFDVSQGSGAHGIQIFAPVDPYQLQERKEFRSAMDNPYVYRAARIQTSFVTGEGYTTDIVPRKEEEVEDEQLEKWQHIPVYVPYLDKDMTPEQIKDKVDKMAIEMDLDDNIFNAYFLSLEQGRCALALSPLQREEGPDGEKLDYQLPEKIHLIRPEFTLRPVIDFNIGELVGVEVVGLRSDRTDNILEADRMIYVEHGFNNELFSDHYGDSKIARVSDIANTLNIILNQDYERAAEFTWHQPKVFSVPIHPQDAGKEDVILNDFLRRNSNAKGQDIAVTGPSRADDPGVQLLSSGTNSGDIGSLEVMRTGLIKAIITAFGLPGFMLSEGDIGKLGGNANIEEVDMYLNTEIRPETLKMESVIEDQFYDRILAILFKVDNAKDVPVKIIHHYNKPKIQSLLTPEMVNVMSALAQMGLIDESGMREALSLEDAKKETMSKGSDTTPGRGTWIQNPSGLRYNPVTQPGWNIPREDWFNINQPNQWDVQGNVPGKMPKGWSQVDVNTWLDPNKQIWKRQSTHMMSSKDAMGGKK